ncbi:MAG: ThuA domain-containing protein [Chloroflexota bacterium]|nr:ThuA domain-containing protein [Chloroflexota bacterium]
MPINVTVWNEFRHEKEEQKYADVYPDGIHGAIASGLKRSDDLIITTATLDEPEHGLTERVLNATDVLLWWGHKAHQEVDDAIIDRVHHRVLNGMGLIVLHSGHFSKIFRKLMGTTCDLKWREADERERLWVVTPGHPIVDGIDEYIELEQEEMYGEHFDIPPPETLVFVSWFSGGEVFRSGCCYSRGAGKIFYFRPGHESYPTFFDRQIIQVLSNAVRWAAPISGPNRQFGNKQPLERLALRD